MVQWKSIADRLGLTLDEVDQLLKGKADANVCNRLGLTPADFADFVAGRGDSARLTSWLGIQPMDAANEFMRILSREQRIGLLFGVLLRG
jgi:hypothetical protein